MAVSHRFPCERKGKWGVLLEPWPARCTKVILPFRSGVGRQVRFPICFVSGNLIRNRGTGKNNEISWPLFYGAQRGAFD